jgi:glycosyltransferase involved in cell wall biosynthesis
VRVAVVNLTSGGLSGGYVKYLRRLMPLLSADPRVDDLLVLIPPGAPAEAGEGVSLVAWPEGRGVRSLEGLRASLDRFDPDVVFIPTARWFDSGRPTVVMVRNMEPLAAPRWRNPLGERLRNIARKRVALGACRRADRTIAVSQHVREFLLGESGLGEDRVGVVYHGVDAFDESAAERPASLGDLREGSFTFTAGSIRPARGLEELLTAWGELPGEPLVIAGAVDPRMEGYRRRLDRLARRGGIARDLIWAGRLNPAEMAWCYARCKLFVMTSRAEACPNTALEAMSAGCVCVSTDQAPMPEFFEQTAVYYRRQDGSSLRGAVQQALALPAAERAQRGEAGRRRAGAFTWEETARRTVEQLEMAMGGSGEAPSRA